MDAAAFAPAHLTGFFKIFRNGAGGAGLTLQHGMLTSVKKSSASKSTISINGVRSPAPTSNWVLSKFSRHLGFPVAVSHSTALPIGCGLGMSAAGALSLSLALNELAGSPFSYASCTKIAHNADVACGTGLSSVDVQAIGGLVSRKGASGAPEVRKFRGRELSGPLVLQVYGPMRTSSVIRSNAWKERVNLAADESYAVFSKNPCIHSLCLASNIFALQSRLGKWAGAALSSNAYMGMAMLGHTLFYQAESVLHCPELPQLPKPKPICIHPTNLKAHLL